MRRSLSFQTVVKRLFEVICEYSPWFPEEVTLDEEVWKRTCKNVERHTDREKRYLFIF
jgi:hypothetical protein